MRAQLVVAQAAAEQERKDNAVKWEKTQSERKSAVEDERRKGEAETRRLVGFIFFGGAALSLAVGVGCLTVLSGLPFVCGKLTQGCFILAGVIGVVGVGLQAMTHTWIVYAECTAAGLTIAIMTLGYANHWHTKPI